MNRTSNETPGKLKSALHLLCLILGGLVGTLPATFLWNLEGGQSLVLLLLPMLFFAILGYMFAPWLTWKLYYALRRSMRGLTAFRMLNILFSVMFFALLSLMLTLPVMILQPQWGIFVFAVYGFGLILALAVGVYRDEFGAAFLKTSNSGGTRGMAILDSSVLIDRRIIDVAVTGFLVQNLIIPKFILLELQMLADNKHDEDKRAKGQRGLDAANELLEVPNASVEVNATPYDESELKMDERLLAYAAALGASLITNDYNLNRVAEAQKIQVLNINDLTNAMKPVFTPGTALTVRIVKEGKNPGQGLAYMEDGTQVVIEGGASSLGEMAHVEVVNVVQKTRGRMVFARLKD